MLLSHLIQSLDIAGISGNLEVEISGLAYDSRRVRPGAAFVAIRGMAADGHQFIPQAIEAGAVAVICEDLARVPPGVPAIAVPNSRVALAMLADRFFESPSAKLRLIGVTGTNGKTTTTHLIDSIFRAAGETTGIIGTLYTRIGDEVLPTERTTPESLDFQELLACMVQRRVQTVTMEVSSHALALHRTDAARFDAAAFTNLTQDHLDFHKDFEDYFAAKLRLFTDYPDHSPKPFSAVINADDPYGRRMAERSRGTVLTYGIREPADVRASDYEAGAGGISFSATTPRGSLRLSLKLGGGFNVYNSLAAIGIGISQGMDLEIIRRGLEAVSSVPGRFEAVDEGQPFAVLVDYAHTPDGLENVASSAARLTRGRKIIVFGCGGNRDRGKRPIMGEIAARYGDLVVVTSDNPRKEEPEAIIQDILAGIPAEARSRVVVEPDRARAIGKAIEMAEPGDLVLIAGKGHETYQIFADRTIEFDDRKVARQFLRERGFSRS